MYCLYLIFFLGVNIFSTSLSAAQLVKTMNRSFLCARNITITSMVQKSLNTVLKRSYTNKNIFPGQEKIEQALKKALVTTKKDHIPFSMTQAQQNFCNALLGTDYDKMEEALKQGADINAPTNNITLDSALHAAVFEYITTPSIDEGMLLESSKYHGVSEKIRFLLRHRACPNKKNFQDTTPLMIAVRYSEKIDQRCLSVVTVLLCKGADIYAKDQNGFTVIDYAEGKENAESLYGLLEEYELTGFLL